MTAILTGVQGESNVLHLAIGEPGEKECEIQDQKDDVDT